MTQCVEVPRTSTRPRRIKAVPVPVPTTTLSPRDNSPDYSLGSSHTSDRRDTADWHYPTAEDPIDLMRRGLRVFDKPSDRGRGFDPFGYDTQLFGSWGQSASP